MRRKRRSMAAGLADSGLHAAPARAKWLAVAGCPGCRGCCCCCCCGLALAVGVLGGATAGAGDCWLGMLAEGEICCLGC